ncbi:MULTISPECIES: response regulator transcription factor [Clostridium]|uniref:Stage 0 sporulation protein A homolog n=2 Tax=Clostridium TaxID=1485 RepID=D8GP91_CLOLD|nr:MULTISPECIES: response regulator [Clostridium]ADK15969.1 predicted transcriptional regulator [Clostridium ljungdahlii DSM 13528]AGY75140.1 response regulator [Clostridium autoethanogenum DSM 10061]ALU35311.1 Response regulator receiver protein [Clostridium autoethanogenum DSM 10061]OAA87157.1 Transcriptional regulatory protein PhoP [Clostridium ljungdahlii DSM 13528]OVY49610.1 Transcriptional regulatory protein PhoP [Clostridium autoethanogenum]
MNKVIILDDMIYVRYRVRRVLEDAGIGVYECGNSFEFFNRLYDKKEEINLIILEVGLSTEDGFEVLKKIKAKKLNIPVMILTKLNSREAFIKGIKAGTSEYILKPFNSKNLVKRIMKLIKSSRNSDRPEEIVYLNFQEYIARQIMKCGSQNKKLSIIMVSLVKKYYTEQEEKIEVKDSYLILLDLVYEKLRSLFKVPDLFEKYGLSTFISVVPDCNYRKVVSVVHQMECVYNKIKIMNEKYSEYDLKCSYVIFPDDGTDKNYLMNKLNIKMKMKINKEK